MYILRGSIQFIADGKEKGSQEPSNISRYTEKEKPAEETEKKQKWLEEN